MKSTTIPTVLLAILVGTQFVLLGQSPKPALPIGDTKDPVSVPHPTASPAAQEGPVPQVPVVKLDFKAEPAVPGAPTLSVLVSPNLCSPDGAPFFDSPQPPDYVDHVVYSLGPKGAKTFNPKSIPGLFDVKLRSYFASDSAVGMLVTATKEDKKSGNTYTMVPGTPPRSVYLGEHHDYLALFDREGSFKEVLDLPAAYNFVRLASLPDGDFIAVATDRINWTPRLLILGRDGLVTREIAPPGAMMEGPDWRPDGQGVEHDRARAMASLSWWLLIPARQRVLLYQAHSRSPILEVGAGGSVREVPISVPPGFSLDGAVPSNDRWILRYKKEADGGADETNPSSHPSRYALYEMDPNDGSLRSRLEVDIDLLFGVACEQDGVLTAFSVADGKVILKAAELPR